MPLTKRSLLKLSLASAPLLAAGAQAGTDERSIIQKPIHSSGELIPVVGIGTNRYSVGDSEAERSPLRATLKTFAELGGKVIDTAPGYGSSEEVLGQLIAELGIGSRLFMATKVDREGRQAGIDRMRDSLRKLRMPRVDLMQVHNLRDTRTQLETMFAWKAEGAIRYVGVTTSRQSQHEMLEELMQQHALDFVQLNYSLADRAAADRLLPLALERRIAVLVNLPLGRGKLFKAVGESKLPAWAVESGVHSWGQFFLKYVVSHPAVTCAIPGTRKQHHVVDNMGAATGQLFDSAQRARQESLFDTI